MNSNISISVRSFLLSFWSKSETSQETAKTEVVSSSEKKKKNSSNKQPQTSVSIIGSGCKIVGSLQVDNDVRFEGILEGDINCENSVILGEQCKVTGNISAKDVTIAGTHNGDIKVTQIVKLKKTAVITGNIIAPKMMAEYGSSINGKCEIGS